MFLMHIIPRPLQQKCMSTGQYSRSRSKVNEHQCLHCYFNYTLFKYMFCWRPFWTLSHIFYIYRLYKKMVQAENNCGMWNDCSFCCFLNHTICFFKSTVMLCFVRQGKIPFVPLFIFIKEIFCHESFNNKKVKLWGQWWKKLLKHLLILYLLLSSTHTNIHTHTHT